MANTNSIAFPNMLNVAQNTVAVLEDNQAVANRVKLMLLTEPTEMYNTIKFGAGLKRYLFQYNTDNTQRRMKDQIVEQLREYEPCVNADNTKFADGLLYTGGNSESSAQDANHLKTTMILETTYSESVSIDLDSLKQEGLGDE